nr:BPSS1780 family membrane protein [uncultured Albidiferax sp.]
MKLQIVPARTGFLWVKLGIQAYFKQPLAMTGLFFLFMAALSVINLVPLLGNFVALALLPTMALGLMMATHEASQGRFPQPTVLYKAFRADPQRLRGMLVLGAMYAAGFVLLLGITSLVDGGEFVRRFLGLGGSASQSDSPLELQQGMLVFMALHLPLSLAFWHAPALVHWHGITPGKSVFFSLVACWRNKGAYMVFGFTWFALVMVGGLAVQILAMLLSLPALMGVGILVLTLLTTSMFLTSIYFTFRDSFTADPAEEAAPIAIE